MTLITEAGGEITSTRTGGRSKVLGRSRSDGTWACRKTLEIKVTRIRYACACEDLSEGGVAPGLSACGDRREAREGGYIHTEGPHQVDILVASVRNPPGSGCDVVKE